MTRIIRLPSSLLPKIKIAVMGVENVEVRRVLDLRTDGRDIKIKLPPEDEQLAYLKHVQDVIIKCISLVLLYNLSRCTVNIISN